MSDSTTDPSKDNPGTIVPSSGSGTTTPTAKPAQAVLTEKDIGRMIDLGLGRGVNATDPRPWLGKSPFQVRRVCIDNVIGTEEGGSVFSYENEISSVQNLQCDLKASITVPKCPVTIGVDGDLSRDLTSTRRSVGRKVVNRSIAFRQDFEENGLEQKVREATDGITRPVYAASEDAAYKAVTDPKSGLTFEERLAKWVMERILHRKKMHELDLISAQRPIPRETLSISGRPLTDLANIIHGSSDEERKEIVKDCQAFVNHFRITHYVSAIQLGASEYKVLNESEYFLQASASGSLGIESFATAAMSQKYSKKVKGKASERKTIGKIDKDGTVMRGSYNEAVVGASFRPISSLVKLRYLYLALRKALLNFMDDQVDRSSGPFIISCDSDRLFWKVNTGDGYSVGATRDMSEASAFYIVPTEHSHPYDFIIAYRNEDHHHRRPQRTLTSSEESRFMQPMPRYLLTRVNVFGHNPGPLHLHYIASESHSRLLLHGRLTESQTTVDLSKWVNGSEMYFLHCAQRFLKKDGYVCIKSQGRGQNQRYITACVASKSSHNDRDTWMLFHLIPKSYQDTAAKSSDLVDGNEDNELEEYDRLLSTNSTDLRPLVPSVVASSPRGATLPLRPMVGSDQHQEPHVMVKHPTIQGY